MTAQSMTGFGQSITNSSNFIVSVELKSVNHRFKDLRFKMPSTFNSLEVELKKEINDNFSRGSFDIYVNIKRAENKSKFDDLDIQKVGQFVQKVSALLKNEGVTPQLSMTDLLRSEFLLDQDEANQEELVELLRTSFSRAIDELKNSRISEGEKLIKVLQNHLDNYRKHFEIIEKNADHFKSIVEEKLKKRVEEYKTLVAIEPNRLLQEVVFYLEKIDIHEEINRIHSHLEKFQNLLKLDSDVGRQIDFLLQELGRETNTIGSKSGLKEISDSVVQMKLQLEKMREQGLNIE